MSENKNGHRAVLLEGPNGDAIRLSRLGVWAFGALFGIILALGAWNLSETHANSELLHTLLERTGGLPERVHGLELDVAGLKVRESRGASSVGGE